MPVFGQITANDWFDKGNVFFNQSKYADAIQAYDKAIQLDPNDADVWYNKGVSLERLGRPMEVNAAFAKAKELGIKANSSSLQCV